MDLEILKKLDKDPDWEWSDPRPKNNTRLTEDLIKSWAEDYRRINGRYPVLSSSSEVIPPEYLLNWRSINACLMQKLRGLTFGGSLFKLLHPEHKGRTLEEYLKLIKENKIKNQKHWCEFQSDNNYDGLGFVQTPYTKLNISSKEWAEMAFGKAVRGYSDLSVRDIVDWANVFKSKHGRYPHQRDLDTSMIPENFGIKKWGQVDHCLRKGHRGLPNGKSLVYLFRPSPLEGDNFINEIKQVALSFFKKNKKLPSVTEDLSLSDGITQWRSVSQYLKQGLRDTKRFNYKGLKDFYKKELSVCGQEAVEGIVKPPLCPLSLKESIKKYIEKEKKRPWAHSDFCHSDGTSSRNIDKYLRDGLRGFLGGSSLSKLVDEVELEMENNNELPIGYATKKSKILSISEIKKELKEYIILNKRNVENSSSDFVLNGTTTSQIKWALQEGLRGLSKGGSLSKLSKEVEEEMRQAGELPEGYQSGRRAPAKVSKKPEKTLDKSLKEVNDILESLK
jgi:hypothetical protein